MPQRRGVVEDRRRRCARPPARGSRGTAARRARALWTGSTNCSQACPARCESAAAARACVRYGRRAHSSRAQRSTPPSSGRTAARPSITAVVMARVTVARAFSARVRFYCLPSPHETPRPPPPPGRFRPPLGHRPSRPAAGRAGSHARAHPRGPGRVPGAGAREPSAAPAVDLPARARRPVRRALRPLAPRGLPLPGRDPHRDAARSPASSRSPRSSAAPSSPPTSATTPTSSSPARA